MKRLQRSALLTMLADERQAHGSCPEEALCIPLDIDFTLLEPGPFPSTCVTISLAFGQPGRAIAVCFDIRRNGGGRYDARQHRDRRN